MSESYYIRRKVKRRSELGRMKAKVRWANDRQRRDKLAALTAEQYPRRIARRIIVIDDETTVRESVIWNWESGRSARRKERAVLSPPVKLTPFFHS